jgi:hypothetical protein
MPWYLVVTAVEANINDRWVVLYVQQWFKAPLQLPDGALQKRDRGSHRAGRSHLWWLICSCAMRSIRGWPGVPSCCVRALRG